VIASNNDALDPEDMALLRQRENARNARKGPRSGDYVIMPDGATRRFCSDGLSLGSVTGGRYHLDRDGRVQYSGGLDHHHIRQNDLRDTGRTKLGSFWFFHRDKMQARNDITVQLDCRVFEFSPESGKT